MKFLEWLAALISAWSKAGKNGQIEIHFHEGQVVRIVESAVIKPPQ